MSQKFLKKNIEKMAKRNDYFILDGENYGITTHSASKQAIASEFKNSMAVGGFCPESRLYSMIEKKKKKEEINEDKYEREIEYFLTDKAFISAACVAYRAVMAKGDTPLNIFVVLPNIVYKMLGKKIIKKMIKLGKLSFDAVFSQEDIKENKDRLKKSFGREQLDEIKAAAKRIEKKYELKFSVPDEYPKDE